MITPVKLFSPDMGQVTDFSQLSAGAIFNQSIAPQFEDMDLEEPEPQQMELLQNLYQEPKNQFLPQRQPSQSAGVVSEPQTDYDAPVTPVAAPAATPEGDLDLKLSNYGYDSDSSPDYNSNVLRIGHADNPLEDGVSAALTKSLASRFGLKTGDMFEATTSTGEVLRRRYDDTVPGTFKGRALPETIDLYNLKGNNKFGGKIVNLRPLSS